MPERLRVLDVGIGGAEASRLEAVLTAGGFVVDRREVTSGPAMRSALASEDYDAVLCRAALDSYDAHAALALHGSLGQDRPFLVLASRAELPIAVELMREGAHDLVLWDELERLVPALERELREANNRRVRLQSDEQLALAAEVFESGREAIAITDRHGAVISLNSAFADMTGWPLDESVGQRLDGLLALDAPGRMRIWEAIENAGRWRGEVYCRRRSGEIYPAMLSLSTVRYDDGGIKHTIAHATDVTEHKAAEQRIHYLAHYDALTGLPNRTLLRERLAQALRDAELLQHKVAVIAVDLDRFQVVNDRFGHAHGDRVLGLAAHRIVQIVETRDIVARVGDDEFAIIVKCYTSEAATALAYELLEAIGRPFEVEGARILVTPGLGLALYPDDASEVDTLLRAADTALFGAKESGGGAVEVYDRSRPAMASERLALADALSGAIERGELELHYQPQLDVTTGRVVGAEALVRWRHPELGLLMPGRFLSIAEETGLAVPIGEWVLREACRQNAHWQRVGRAKFPVAVNVSRAQLRHPRFIRALEGALIAASLEPRYLEIELTEAVLVEHPDATSDLLRRVAALGVLLSIDDFGTSHSSLHHLKRFAVCKIKIDTSFVATAPSVAEDATIVRAVIGLAHGLGQRVTAEGVETEAQLDFLARERCDEYQGRYASGPLLGADFLRFLSH